MGRIATSLAVALIGMAATNVAAAEMPIPYKEVPLTDPTASRLWSDDLADADPVGKYPPWALVGTVDIGDGRKLTITQLWAGGLCGINSCPLRIYEGDRRLVDEDACDSPDHHSISDDGRIFLACGVIILTNRR